jgi:beta-lactamase regulating signal transducer with metallopeptidase domain
VIRLDGIRSSPWTDAVGWALLHSVWEGAAVALALALVLRVLRRATAQARYLAACAAMLGLIALPASSLWRSPAIVSHARVHQFPERAVPALEPMTEPQPGGNSVLVRPWHSLLDRLRPILPAVVAIWTAGIALGSLRLAGGWLQASRWVWLDTHLLAGSLIDRLNERLGISRRVALLTSSRVAVPMVIGWLRPAILVPVAALSGMTALEMEAILAHELAHIRRHDYLVNVFQCVIETLMFHHPATWWISRAIRHEREHCCDDIAVLACRDRLVYARALAAMEGLRAPSFSLSPAAGGGNLLARIRRIHNPVEDSMNPARILVAFFAIAALVPFCLVRADDQNQASPDSGRSDFVRGEPFPNRSYVDNLTLTNLAPAGQFSTDADRAPDQGTRLALSDAISQSGGSSDPLSARDQMRARNSLLVLADDAVEPENPPSESEVWAKVSPLLKSPAALYEVQRNNIRIVVEKIADTTDPVCVYALAGPCQLVHRHYKCTAYFDEVVWGDSPTPFNHVDHKVEVVYIDKDFLRRAVAPGAPGDSIHRPIATRDRRGKRRDERIDRVLREVQQLKRELQSDLEGQDRALDLIIKELETLKSQITNTQS